MNNSVKPLDPDTAIDLDYDIFLEMASENLDPADILQFTLLFVESGAVAFVKTTDNWEAKIGVLIDPQDYADVWIGLLDDKHDMTDIFAKFLISHREEEREFHVVWKE